jgi:hypothetical protein
MGRLQEIKHDGFRITQERRAGEALFPLIAERLTRLRSRSCIIDGEAVA